MTDTAARLHRRLTAALQPTHLELQDDSQRHAGHPHPQSHGGDHISLIVVSAQFEGQSLVARHRAVYAAAGELLKQEIHSLSMKTLTPEEWEQANQQ